jgi:uncharacterized protein YciI
MTRAFSGLTVGLVTTALLFAPQSAPAQTVRDSILAAVNESFHAMTANDAAASLRVLMADGVGFSIRPTPEGLTVRRETHEKYHAGLATNRDTWVERIWAPVVLVHGPIAMVWAPYDFHVNGEFRHCGIDAMTLIRTAAGWQSATWTWSVVPQGCSPGPLGPLTEAAARYPVPKPIPTVWDTSYIVLLEANRDYREDAGTQSIMQAHFQYQLRLIADGQTIRGGPLVPEQGNALVGVTVLRAGSMAEAEALAAADPAVAAGVFVARVRPWTTPAGDNTPAFTADDRAAVVATVEEFFRGMTANDATASRRVLIDGGVNFATREDPDGLYLRRFTHEDYLGGLTRRTDTVVERMWEPTVIGEGRIAILWTPYDIYSNGEFLHCGVDAFALLNTEDGWRITSIAFTMEPTGCAPSPLGPLPPR